MASLSEDVGNVLPVISYCATSAVRDKLDRKQSLLMLSLCLQFVCEIGSRGRSVIHCFAEWA